MNLRWEAGTELFEYQCQQMNYANELMVGQLREGRSQQLHHSVIVGFGPAAGS